MDPKTYVATVAAAWKRPFVDPKVYDGIEHKTPIKPAEYLKFAEQDLRRGGVRGFVNAMGNSKRAIDCQIHVVLEGLGVSASGNFPQKLERIEQLGLVAPRILKKTVQLRNRLEHDFHRPHLDEAENAVDVATLFLETLRPLVAGSYMSNGWIADASSANPFSYEKSGSRVTWDRSLDPRFTFSSGILVNSDLKDHSIALEFVHDNAVVAELLLSQRHPLYLRLQAFLLRCRAENYRYHSRKGAIDFLALISDLES